MRQILLDTNALSLYFKKDKRVFREVEEADLILISAVTFGELKYGFLKGSLTKDNNLKLNSFLDNPLVKLIEIGKNSGIIYGEIYYKLQKLGLPIPTNDVWIAACAIETGSILVTYDNHFLKIPNLKVWKYLNSD